MFVSRKSPKVLLTAAVAALVLLIAPLAAAPAANAAPKSSWTYFIPKKLPKYDWTKECDSCVLPSITVQTRAKKVGIILIDGGVGVACGVVKKGKRITLRAPFSEDTQSVRFKGSAKHPRITTKSSTYRVPKNWHRVTWKQFKAAERKVYQGSGFTGDSRRGQPLKACK